MPVPYPRRPYDIDGGSGPGSSETSVPDIQLRDSAGFSPASSLTPFKAPTPDYYVVNPYSIEFIGTLRY